MKIQMLPSTIDENGRASARQHLLTFVIDDRVAIDAGCLALSCSDLQRAQVRDVVLTHTHLDHIAGLPLYIDDLFGSLTEPIRIHATSEMVGILERDLFNWSLYPRFSELSNANGPVVEYREFERESTFDVRHLSIRSIPVNHKVSANGFIISDGDVSIAITGDTAETDEIWKACDEVPNLKAIFAECAFPDEMTGLATVSDHLTPARLKLELDKLETRSCPVFAINIKPMYRETVVKQLENANISNLNILEVGKIYEF